MPKHMTDYTHVGGEIWSKSDSLGFARPYHRCTSGAFGALAKGSWRIHPPYLRCNDCGWGIDLMNWFIWCAFLTVHHEMGECAGKGFMRWDELYAP
jgi:hypothetical protein